MSLLLLFNGTAGGESLADGDLAIAVRAWLDAEVNAADLNMRVRDSLATHYGTDGGEDLMTLLTRFVCDRSGS